jgi:AraC family transcriptional activator of pobA
MSNAHGTIQNLEAHPIRPGLDSATFSLKGQRTHLILLETGQIQFRLTESAHDYVGPVFIWLPLGQARTFTIGPGARGWRLSMPDLHIKLALPPGTIGTNLAQILHLPAFNTDLSRTQIAQMGHLVERIEEELRDQELASATATQYCISLLLIKFWRIHKPVPQGGVSVPRNIVHSFIFLIDLHLKDHWTIDQYARQIGVSKERLTTAVRRATQKSPLELVHAHLMAEAKSMLENSSMQVAEVAYALGFRDAAYFNRFFSKIEGISPGRFRQQFFADRNRVPRTYAAWP